MIGLFELKPGVVAPHLSGQQEYKPACVQGVVRMNHRLKETWSLRKKMKTGVRLQSNA
jgi:hypothetical protein